MTSPKDNPNDVFWLARYAHNTLNPVIAKLPGQDDKRFAYLYLGITEHKFYGGLNIYVHGNGLDNMVDSHTYRVTKESVDDMAERLPRKWQEALDADVVTA
jgi:broad specificity phosphatase PhoE